MAKAYMSCFVGTCALLAVLGTALPAAATWPTDPAVNVPVCTAAGAQNGVVIAPDGSGGTVIAWRDYRNGFQQMYAQRLDASGAPMWTPDGVMLGNFYGSQTYPAIVGDASGGAIVIWLDWREATPGMYAQRVGNDGNTVWAAGGVRVAAASSGLPECTAISDNAGGAIVAWRDVRNGGLSLVAQRINFGGGAQWGIDGLVLQTTTGDLGVPALATDVVGGAVVVWHEDPVGDPFNPNYDLSALHVANNGLVAWTTFVCNAAGDQTQPVIVADGTGGVIVVWQDSRNGGQDLYSQRMQPWGDVAWDIDGVPVSTAVDDQIDPSITTDGAGGAIVAWRDRRGGDFDIYAQSLAADGSARWTADGLALVQAAGNQIFPVAATDLAGGAIVAWTDLRSAVADIYARHVLADGALQGPAGGVALATAGGTQDEPVIASDNVGGAVVAWRDYRAGPGDIYAQRLTVHGALGSEPVIAHVQDIPNDQGGRLKLSWYGSGLDADPAYSIGSYWIWRSVPPNYAARALAGGAVLIGAEKAVSPVVGGTLMSTTEGGQTIFWEFVGSQFASGDVGYSYVVPTVSDSIAGSNPRTMVRVQARAATGSGFWNSPPDSGYSVDNLAPAQPLNFAASHPGGATALHWVPVVAPDLAGYRLYRGATADFVPGQSSFVVSQPDTGYVDAVAGSYFYKLCAVDIHGNLSAYALVSPQYASGVDAHLPLVAMLSQNAPNPFNPRTVIRFTLPAAGSVRLSVYDVAGRLVRTLADAGMSAGTHEVAWDGCDDAGRGLSSGSYLARLAFGGRTETSRMMLIR